MIGIFVAFLDDDAGAIGLQATLTSMKLACPFQRSVCHPMDGDARYCLRGHHMVWFECLDRREWIYLIPIEKDPT